MRLPIGSRNRLRQRKPSTRKMTIWGGQDTPKQARIFIAIEDNEENGMVTASLKSNSPKVMLDAFFKLAQQEETFANLIKATAAKLRLVEKMKEDTKTMPAPLREAMEHLINIL